MVVCEENLTLEGFNSQLTLHAPPAVLTNVHVWYTTLRSEQQLHTVKISERWDAPSSNFKYFGHLYLA